MELDLQRTVLEGYRPVLDTVLTTEETMDNIVPDAYPDVSRIISADGSAFVTMKQANEGGAKVMGTANICVLYVPEGERSPRAITLELPFQCAGDHTQISPRSQLHGTVLSVSADARLLNPRKLFVKAEVKVSLRVYNPESREVACDLAAKDEALQKRMKAYKDFSAAAVLEKPFLFSDMLRQSSSKPAMEELLYCHGEPGMIEAKYIGKKLVCKGELLLSVLYRSGSEVIPARFELPYSQILDLEGGYDEGEPDVAIALKSMDCRLQEGEIEVSVEALIQAALWSQRSVTLLSDVYSTAAPLEVETAPVSLCTTSVRGSRRESARKFCESGIPAKQVLHCAAFMSPLTSQKTEGVMKYAAEAFVDILYLSEDDALCGVNYTVPVSCEVELPSDCGCSCSCRPVGEVLAVPVTGGFEVRMEVEFNWHTMKMETVPVVSAVRSGKEAASKEPKPSLIIRMVGSEEHLWDIAKACGSTIQDICAANGMVSDTTVPGTVLLIPTHR